MGLHLSKTKYCSGAQCPKMLWLKENKPDAYDDSLMNALVLENGNEAGDLAMGLFGDYTEVPFNRENLEGMVETTADLIKKGTSIIAEASFTYDNNFCSVDILKNIGQGSVEIYEVKSSANVKNIYYHDICFQAFVLEKCGYHVQRACLVHIDREYERIGSIDLQKLFVIDDLTDLARGSLSKIEDIVTRLKKYVDEETEPQKNLGIYCMEPYDCGCFGYCSRNLPSPNIFDINRIMPKTKIQYYNKNCVSMEDIVRTGGLNSHAMLQVNSNLNLIGPQINIGGIKKFIEDIHLPLYVLDLSCSYHPVPPFDYVKPYGKVPYVCTLWYQETASDQWQHCSVFVKHGENPFIVIGRWLLDNIPEEGSLLGYGVRIIRDVLDTIARYIPEKTTLFQEMRERIIDVQYPFYHDFYYIREMNGSFKLEAVFKALYPDDKTFSDGDMENLQCDEDAIMLYKKLNLFTDDEQNVFVNKLIRYSLVRSRAVVKLYNKLVSVAESSVL